MQQNNADGHARGEHDGNRHIAGYFCLFLKKINKDGNKYGQNNRHGNWRETQKKRQSDTGQRGMSDTITNQTHFTRYHKSSEPPQKHRDKNSGNQSSDHEWIL